ncbi:DUF348 domain-containing protein [Alicyclobacillaceae bacterium I2511]|nr:DUF348 domain-containing protein [Alicyclobacillaceae bacterium I2511]
MRIPKSRLLYVSAAGVAALTCASVVGKTGYKTITVLDNGQRKQVSGFTFGQLDGFLESHDISVDFQDRVQPSVTATVTNGMTVVIRRPNRIRLVDAGATVDLYSYATTVGQLLKDQGIRLTSADRVSLPLNASVASGMTLSIQHVSHVTQTKTETLQFQTIRQRTDRLYAGQTRMLTRGVKGSVELKTVQEYINGRRVGEYSRRRVVRPVQNEVLAVGIKPRPMLPQVSSRGYAGSVILHSWTVVATAYVAGGITATGDPARPGVIAVDPAVIPFGTKLYIPGIGIVRAEDTGGAIQGTRIDICVSSQAIADQWGVRTVTIYEVQ